MQNNPQDKQEQIKLHMQELYSRPCHMFNVGAMMPWMDYTPSTLDEIELLSSGWREVPC